MKSHNFKWDDEEGLSKKGSGPSAQVPRMGGRDPCALLVGEHSRQEGHKVLAQDWDLPGPTVLPVKDAAADHQTSTEALGVVSFRVPVI